MMMLARLLCGLAIVAAAACDSKGSDTPAEDSGNTPADGATPTPEEGGTMCAATSCATCTPMGQCGWCAATNSCTRGSSNGANAGACADPDSGMRHPMWSYLSSQCTDYDAGPPPPDMCPTATTCDTCTPMGPCGWCFADNRCYRGGSSGAMSGGPCMAPAMGTAMNWTFLRSGCTDSGAMMSTDSGT